MEPDPKRISVAESEDAGVRLHFLDWRLAPDPALGF